MKKPECAKPRGGRKLDRNTRMGTLMVLPMILAIVFFMIYPVFSGASMSVHNAKDEFVGMQNYALLVGESRFSTNVFLTLLYTAVAVTITISLGLLAAQLITERGKFVTVLRPILFLPWLIPPIASSIFFRALFDANTGPIPTTFKVLTGKTIMPLTDAHLSMVVVVMHEVWRSLPFAMLFLAAGLTAVPKYLYEAAAIDSAGKWKQFLHITLPSIKSHLFIITLMVTNGTLQDSQSIYPLTSGGPGYATETLGVRLFKSAFVSFEVNFASALGMVLLVIAALFMVLYSKGMKMKEGVSFE